MRFILSLLVLLFIKNVAAAVICSEMITPNYNSVPSLNITFTGGLNLTLPNNHTIRSFVASTFQFSTDPNFSNATFNYLLGYLKDFPVISTDITGSSGNGSVSPGLQEDYYYNYIRIPIRIWPHNSTLYVRYRAIPSYGMDIYDGGTKISSFSCNATRSIIYMTYLAGITPTTRKSAYIYFSGSVKNCDGTFTFPFNSILFKYANARDGPSDNPTLTTGGAIGCTATWKVLPGLPGGRSDVYYCQGTSTTSFCTGCYPQAGQMGFYKYAYIYANVSICGLDGSAVQASMMTGMDDTQENVFDNRIHAPASSGSTTENVLSIQVGGPSITISTSTRLITSISMEYGIPLSGGAGYRIIDSNLRYATIYLQGSVFTTVQNLQTSVSSLPTASITNSANSATITFGQANGSPGTMLYSGLVYVSIQYPLFRFLNASYAMLIFDTSTTVYFDSDVPIDDTLFDSRLLTQVIHCVDGNSVKIPMIYHADNITKFLFATVVKPITCYVVYSSRMNPDSYSRFIYPDQFVNNNEPVLVTDYPNNTIIQGSGTYVSDNNTVTIQFGNTAYGINISAIKLDCGYENATANSYYYVSDTVVVVYYTGCSSAPYSYPYLVMDSSVAYFDTFNRTSVPLTDNRFPGNKDNCLPPTVNGTAIYKITGTTNAWVVITCSGQVFNRTLDGNSQLSLTRQDCHIYGALGSSITTFSNNTCFFFPAIQILSATLVYNGSIYIVFNRVEPRFNVSLLTVFCDSVPSPSLFSSFEIYNSATNTYKLALTQEPTCSNLTIWFDPFYFFTNYYWIGASSVQVTDTRTRFPGSLTLCDCPSINGTANYVLPGSQNSWLVITCSGNQFVNYTLEAGVVLHINRTDCFIDGYQGQRVYLNDTRCYYSAPPTYIYVYNNTLINTTVTIYNNTIVTIYNNTIVNNETIITIYNNTIVTIYNETIVTIYNNTIINTTVTIYVYNNTIVNTTITQYIYQNVTVNNTVYVEVPIYQNVTVNNTIYVDVPFDRNITIIQYLTLELVDEKNVYIIGGITGGLFLITFFSLCYVLRAKKKAKKLQQDSEQIPLVPTTLVTAHVTPPSETFDVIQPITIPPSDTPSTNELINRNALLKIRQQHEFYKELSAQKKQSKGVQPARSRDSRVKNAVLKLTEEGEEESGFDL